MTVAQRRIFNKWKNWRKSAICSLQNLEKEGAIDSTQFLCLTDSIFKVEQEILAAEFERLKQK